MVRPRTGRGMLGLHACRRTVCNARRARLRPVPAAEGPDAVDPPPALDRERWRGTAVLGEPEGKYCARSPKISRDVRLRYALSRRRGAGLSNAPLWHRLGNSRERMGCGVKLRAA